MRYIEKPRVFILAEQRSGSILCQNLLWKYCYEAPFIKIFGKHSNQDNVELWHITPESLTNFNYNLHPYLIPILAHWCETQYGLDFIQTLKDANYKFIQTKRENKLRQAISLVYGKTTDKFHARNTTNTPKNIDIHISDVNFELAHLGKETASAVEIIQKYKLNPFEVVYEKDLQSNENWVDFLHRVKKYLGVPELPIDISHIDLKKTWNDVTETSYQKILQHHVRLKDWQEECITFSKEQLANP